MYDPLYYSWGKLNWNYQKLDVPNGGHPPNDGRWTETQSQQEKTL